jgi:hypothetical protein
LKEDGMKRIPYLVAIALVALAASAAAQEDAEVQRETLGWFGVSLGLPASLHLGAFDVFAEDFGLRVDVSFLWWPFAERGFLGEAGPEGSIKVIYNPGDPGLRGYLGGGLLLGSVERSEFCIWGPCPPPEQGFYLGATAIAGFETGSEAIRFFIEAGVSYSLLVSGDTDPTRLRLGVALGVNLGI